MKKIQTITLILLTLLLASTGVFILMLNKPLKLHYGGNVDTVMAYKDGYAFIQIYGGFFDEKKFDEYAEKETTFNLFSMFFENASYKTVGVSFYKDGIQYYTQKCDFEYILNQRNEALCKIKVNPLQYLGMRRMTIRANTNNFFTLENM